MAFERSGSILEKGRLYLLRLAPLVTQTQFAEAVRVGIGAPRTFGMELPDTGSREEIDRFFGGELTWCRQQWEGSAISELTDLPLNTDPRSNLIMAILSLILDCTLNAMPSYLGVLTITMVNYSIKHGNTLMTPFGYIWHAVFLLSEFRDYDSAAQFGTLALRLNEDKIQNPNLTAKLLVMFAASINYLKDPLQEKPGIAVRAYRAGLESGDFVYASYGAIHKVMGDLSAGAPLPDVVANSEEPVAVIIDEPDVPLARPIRISDGDAAPAGIIRYVARTREQVVLENAIREGDFTRDPYIRKNRTTSALCVPLLNQGRVSGIIYLENNLTTGAFTQNRMELLQLLSSRIAVSIDNARLYQQARREIEERKKVEEELKKHRDHLELLVKKRTNALIQAKELAEEAQREAESANRAESDFLANMSHELRTPLNAVLGFSEILRHGEKDEKKSHFLESIHTSGEVLLSLINDVLDLSKIEAGKLELHCSAVSLPAFIKETERIFTQKAREKGLELVALLSPDLPRTLLLDETRVRQVCINLMGNAVKFTEKGVVRLEISGDFPHGLKGSKVNLRIIIEDTGKGISEGEIDTIFDAFQQIKGQEGDQYDGTGLGLAITRRLVEMMDGEIAVKSEEGRGTVFTVVLPDVEAAAGDVIEKLDKNETWAAGVLTFESLNPLKLKIENRELNIENKQPKPLNPEL